MKNIISLILLVLSTTFVSAQTFTIKDHSETHSSGEIYAFPILSSTTNSTAAQKINNYLQNKELEKTISGSNGAFENIWPKKDEMGGTTSYGYEIISNNDRFICIAINAEGCGAYCEGYSTYYNFNAHTGDFIKTAELFTPSGWIFFKEMLYTQKTHLINETIKTLNKEIKDKPNDADLISQNNEAIEMYKECRDGKDTSIQYSQFSLSDKSITEICGRCSNHAMRALDVIDDFHTEISLQDILLCLNQQGLKLFNLTATQANTKIYSGTINSSIKIYLCMENKTGSNQTITGKYFYTKVWSPISLKGTNNAGQILLTETGTDGKVTGTFSLNLAGTILTGKWINPTTKKEMPVALQEVVLK